MWLTLVLNGFPIHICLLWHILQLSINSQNVQPAGKLATIITFSTNLHKGSILEFAASLIHSGNLQLQIFQKLSNNFKLFYKIFLQIFSSSFQYCSSSSYLNLQQGPHQLFRSFIWTQPCTNHTQCDFSGFVNQFNILIEAPFDTSILSS